MPLMTWSDGLSVGVGKFDDQHKKLIGLINELHDAMSSGKGKEVLGKILTELVDYTVYHFSAEETLFRLHNYPNTDKHIQEHTALTQKAKELKAAFESGKTMITLTTSTFLTDWLKNHIMKVDKEYSAFFNSKGIK